MVDDDRENPLAKRKRSFEEHQPTRKSNQPISVAEASSPSSSFAGITEFWMASAANQNLETNSRLPVVSGDHLVDFSPVDLGKCYGLQQFPSPVLFHCRGSCSLGWEYEEMDVDVEADSGYGSDVDMEELGSYATEWPGSWDELGDTFFPTVISRTGFGLPNAGSVVRELAGMLDLMNVGY